MMASLNTINHLRHYISQMEIKWANDPIMCKTFSSTLKGTSFTWFGTLRGQKFANFKVVGTTSLRHFVRSWPPPNTVHNLLKTHQQKEESLQDYCKMLPAWVYPSLGPHIWHAVIGCHSRLAARISHRLQYQRGSYHISMTKFMDRTTKFMNSKEINRPFYHSSFSSFDKDKTCDKGFDSKKHPFPSSPFTSRSLDLHLPLRDMKTNITLIN